MIGGSNRKRLAAIVALALLGLVAGRVSALALSAAVAALLTALAVWEFSRTRAAVD